MRAEGSGAPVADRAPGKADGRALPPVLCYHKIERRRELGVTRISPRRFARQIEVLAADGWRTLSLAEFAACARGERAPSGRDLLITFDDAYRGLRDHAFPALESVGFRATCFVITGYAGRLNRWDVAYGGRRFAHLAWRDIERWRSRGMDFASHTITHPRLPWVGDDTMAYELWWSRETLESALGTTVRALSFPFGAATARERTAAAAAGYSLAFGLAGRWHGDPLAIPRTAVYCWSGLRPAVGPLGAIERMVAGWTTRCSVGTTLWRAWTGGGA